MISRASRTFEGGNRLELHCEYTHRIEAGSMVLSASWLHCRSCHHCQRWLTGLPPPSPGCTPPFLHHPASMTSQPRCAGWLAVAFTPVGVLPFLVRRMAEAGISVSAASAHNRCGLHSATS